MRKKQERNMPKKKHLKEKKSDDGELVIVKKLFF